MRRLPEPSHVSHVRRGGADADPLLRVRFVHGADVDEQLLQLNVFRALYLLDAHRSDGPVLEHDLLSQRSQGTDAADGREAQKPVIVDVGDHEANLVHMGRDHDSAGTVAALAPAQRDDVAHRVHPQLIGQRFDQLDDVVPHFVFAARGPVQRREPANQLFQSVDVRVFCLQSGSSLPAMFCIKRGAAAVAPPRRAREEGTLPAGAGYFRSLSSS